MNQKWNGKCPICGSDEIAIDGLESVGAIEIEATYVCGDCDEAFVVSYYNGVIKEEERP